MQSVPGPLKRGQEKCSCPLLSGPGTHQESLFARFFFRDGNIDKVFVRPAVQWRVNVDRASNEKRFASVDEASMVVLEKKRTPHSTCRMSKKWHSIAKITSKRSETWMQLRKNWQRDGPSWARSEVELRSSRSNFPICKISEAFKLHQKSKRARNSEKERKRERERDRIERN